MRKKRQAKPASSISPVRFDRERNCIVGGLRDHLRRKGRQGKPYIAKGLKNPSTPAPCKAPCSYRRWAFGKPKPFCR